MERSCVQMDFVLILVHIIILHPHIQIFGKEEIG
jgi:hypothetical protein